MNAAGFQLFMCWWCEQLVRELLRGAWHFVLVRTGAMQDSAFHRFNCLINAAPCWPCYVEYMHPREMHARAERGWRCWQSLLILTQGQEDESDPVFWEGDL